MEESYRIGYMLLHFIEASSSNICLPEETIVGRPTAFKNFWAVSSRSRSVPVISLVH